MRKRVPAPIVSLLAAVSLVSACGTYIVRDDFLARNNGTYPGNAGPDGQAIAQR
ncbi:hypothetical protein [Nocardia sp. NPDC024068]|uniref:hypothetical protein n=1 Tax=Nocardia sp. NPDC024068 TaxID=3157197 RepID=UPI0033D1FC62